MADDGKSGCLPGCIVAALVTAAVVTAGVALTPDLADDISRIWEGATPTPAAVASPATPAASAPPPPTPITTVAPTSTAEPVPSATRTPAAATPTADDSAQCVPPPAGIVSWWPGAESAQDAVGDNDGQLNGTAGFAPGAVGSGFAFLGGGGYVVVPDSASLALSTAMSVEAWVSPFSPGDNGGRVWLLLKGDSAEPSQLSYGLMWGFTSVHAWIGADTVTDEVIAPGSIERLGQWTHIVATFDGRTFAIYANGTLATSVQSSLSAISSTSQPLVIGASLRHGSVEHYFDGLLDEVTLYNRALDAAEVAALAQATGGKCMPG